MDRKDAVRIFILLLLVPLGVAETMEPWTDLGNIAGKLVFYQMEGNATYVRNTGQLASDVPTETMFELSSPHKNFSTTAFTYTWDLGNGEVIQGTEPVVRYHYSESGNYTLRLKVGVNATDSEVYSMDVQVLDPIKQIKLKEPSGYEMSQNTSLAFHVDGSPPMWVCWRFLPSCVPDVTEGCTLTMLYENTLRLNHTFTSAGAQCLDISLRNNISNLQTSFSLHVRSNYDTQLFLILSCVTVVVATVSFVTGVTCRSRLRNRSKVAASTNGIFVKYQDCDGQNMVLSNISISREEKEPLLLQKAACL